MLSLDTPPLRYARLLTLSLLHAMLDMTPLHADIAIDYAIDFHDITLLMPLRYADTPLHITLIRYYAAAYYAAAIDVIAAAASLISLMLIFRCVTFHTLIYAAMPRRHTC